MLFEKIKLEDDEKIVKIIRKHWFIVVARAVSIAITAVAPLVGWIAVSALMKQSTATIGIDLSAYVSYFVFFFSFWLLINWMTFAYAWTVFYLDVWVITDRRVIVIDQVSLFHRRIGSFRLEKLQDVNIEIHGIIATFLNYGTVECETASENHSAEFRTKGLPKPRELKSTILESADIRMKKTHIPSTGIN